MICTEYSLLLIPKNATNVEREWDLLKGCCDSFNLCSATMSCAHFGTNLEMADEEMFILSLCAASVVAVIMKRRKKGRKNRKTRTREWLKSRTSFGAYDTLLAELRNLDVSSYRNFLRMDVKPMTHGSTSCNICCSTNVEPCCTDVFNETEVISIFVQHRSTC